VSDNRVDGLGNEEPICKTCRANKLCQGPWPDAFDVPARNAHFEKVLNLQKDECWEVCKACGETTWWQEMENGFCLFCIDDHEDEAYGPVCEE